MYCMYVLYAMRVYFSSVDVLYVCAMRVYFSSVDVLYVANMQ